MVEIRFVRETDAAAVQALVSDPAVNEPTAMPWPYPPDGARSYIEESLVERQRGTRFVFAIVAEGELVGLCGLQISDTDASRAELGYWIGRPYWGRGYASSAAAQVVRRAFEALPLSTLTAQCLERNLVSRRVLTRLGFVEASREPNTNPKWRTTDVIIRYELSASERKSPRALIPDRAPDA